MKPRRRTCLRCGYKWYPKADNPKVCPACNSTGWNTPRVYNRAADKMAKRRTKPRRSTYPYSRPRPD